MSKVIWISPIFRNTSEENLFVGSVKIEPGIYFSIDASEKNTWKLTKGPCPRRFSSEQDEGKDESLPLDLNKITEEQLNRLKTCEICFQLTKQNVDNPKEQFSEVI